MPAVSIIMNVRNGAATLRAALESALAQTFQDWELIVWDDCSTDDSARVVAGFSDARIRYFRAPQPTPLGQARDAAMRHAGGEWLAFLDQDDVWLPRKLEQQLAIANNPQVGLIYGRTLCFYADGSECDYDHFHEFTSLPEGDISAELLGKGCFIAMSSALIRRSAVQQVGVIPDDIHVTPDYFLYLGIANKNQARAVQQVVCRYRIHPVSMTSVYRRESLAETLKLVDDWRGSLSSAAYLRRRAHIATALAIEEMRAPDARAQGMRRLLREGSLIWLAGRPFVHAWRWMRRRVRRPYWKKSAADAPS
jgi:glycosyltransferase involved in cell wall biosynthesis